MSIYREPITAKISASFHGRNTVNLHDYEMLSDKVARVILSTSGRMDRDELLAKTSGMFGGLATPVRGSFRRVTDHAIVGFVVAAKEVRAFDPTTEGQKYRAIASNILMDKADETTWEMKEGASGKYLCRQGVEDLSELTASLRVHRPGLPTLAHVEVSSITQQEFVSFVDTSSGDMDNGFVVAAHGDDLEVFSYTSKDLVIASKASVVQAVHFDADDLPEFKEVSIAKLSPESKEALIEYYKFAYRYAPDYVNKILEVIDQQAAA